MRRTEKLKANKNDLDMISSRMKGRLPILDHDINLGEKGKNPKINFALNVAYTHNSIPLMLLKQI